MASTQPFDPAEFQARAGEAAALLKLLANERRLLILCRILQEEEVSVGALAPAVGLSQSALSQHLARLRADGLVATRRAGQTIHYRIGDDRVAKVLGSLKDIYCS